MAFQFPAHIVEKMRRVREYTDSRAAEFASLSDNELAISAEFWRQHCVAPKQVEPDIVVYDSTFWHIIVPEMIKRLKERD